MTFMTHYPASTEYIDGVQWDVTYCGERVQIAGYDTSDGMAMPKICPKCDDAKAKENEG